MKKLLSFIFLLLLSFSLTGCDLGNNSNNNVNDNPTIDNEKENEESKEEEKQEEQIPVNPETPEDSNEKEEESKDDTTSVVTGPTLFSHIDELANNVDTTPEFILHDEAISTYAMNSRSIGTNSTEVDITDPANNPIYQEYLLSDRLYWDSNHTNIKNANNFINYVKSIKEEVIQIVTMLDEWIYSMGNGCKYRVSYDQINDVVYLEKIENNTSYIKIASSYNNNKILIDTYQYVIYSETTFMEYSFHYEEDNILNYYEKPTFENEDKIFMLTSDLSVDNPVSISLSYTTINQGDRYVYEMAKYIYQLSSETDAGLDIFNTYQATSDLSEFYWNNNIVYINNSNDDKVLQFQDSIDTYFYHLDLYELEGYSSLIRGDNHYKLVVKDKEYISENSTEHSSENSITFTTEDYEVCAYISETSGCELYITAVLYNQDISASQILKEFLTELGLSFKDESVSEKLALLDDCDTVLKNYSYFNYSSSYLISPIEMQQIYLINKLPSITFDEFSQMCNSKYVLIDEQIEDENYYLLYSSGVNGSISYNDTNNTLDLSNVSITLNDNSILALGANYSLNAVLKNNNISYLIDKVTIVYEGDFVTISLNDNIEIPKDIEIGQYSIIVYLTTELSNSELRVSNVYTMLGTNEFDVITKLNRDDKTYLLRVVSMDKLIIAIEENFNLTGEVKYNEETQQLDLTNVVGILNHGYILMNTDIVSLSAIIYNAEEEAVYTIENKFNFGSGALSINLDVYGLPQLSEGIYNLKVVFNIVGKNEEQIYNKQLSNISSINGLIIDNERKDIDIIVITSCEEYIEIKYLKAIDVELDVIYENNILDFSNTSISILYPKFYDNADIIHIYISLVSTLDIGPSYMFDNTTTYENFNSTFSLSKVDLTTLSIEAGSYKIEYQIYVSNSNYEMKIDKTYETDLIIDIVDVENNNIE